MSRTSESVSASAAVNEASIVSIPAKWSEAWRKAEGFFEEGEVLEGLSHFCVLAHRVHAAITDPKSQSTLLLPHHIDWILSRLRGDEWFYLNLSRYGKFAESIDKINKDLIDFYESQYTIKLHADLAAKGYVYKKALNSGAFGNVGLYRDTEGTLVAGKSVRFPARKSMRKSAKQECDILLKLPSHPNIMGYIVQLGCSLGGISFPVIIMELARYTLEDFVERFKFSLLGMKDATGRPLVNQLVADLARGIDAIHKVDVAHGDVADPNVLVMYAKDRHIAKYCDMGSSYFCPNREQEQPVRHRYIDFEDKAMCAHFLLHDGFCSLKLTGFEVFAKDMYAVGRLILLLMTRKSLWSKVPFSREERSFKEQRVECAKYISSGREIINLKACGIFSGVVGALMTEDPMAWLTASGLSKEVARINSGPR
ncbi:MAG: hypothetical protein COB66_06665 [Coxiella sp. (in: Bacteria)]|nr:MAG: hypothetical protein COB66_06665 [Coxiella sp. (in: g-proteobacteria)]